MTDIDEIDQKLKKYNLETCDLLKFQKSVDFESIKTDIFCIEYSDKILFTISSSGKFGTVLFVKSEKISGLEDTIYTVKNLFGQFEQSFQVFSRSLLEKLRDKYSVEKPLLITIGVCKEQVNRLDYFKYLENKILEFFQDIKNNNNNCENDTKKSF